MRSVMTVLIGVLLAQEALAAEGRQLLGWCRGVEGPMGVLVEALRNNTAKGARWSVQVRSVDASGPRPAVRGGTDVSTELSFMPAMEGVSWRDLNDGAQRLWTRDLSMWMTPRNPARPSSLAVLSVERASGHCEGAAWISAPPGPAEPGSVAAVLLVPREAVALSAQHDGSLVSMPLVANAPPRKKRRRGRGPSSVGVSLARDVQIVFERTDRAVLPGTTLAAGRAWRVTMLPSRTAGRLTSHVVDVVESGGRTRVLHQVRGALELPSGGGAVEGVLLETLDGPPQSKHAQR